MEDDAVENPVGDVIDEEVVVVSGDVIIKDSVVNLRGVGFRISDGKATTPIPLDSKDELDDAEDTVDKNVVFEDVVLHDVLGGVGRKSDVLDKVLTVGLLTGDDPVIKFCFVVVVVGGGVDSLAAFLTFFSVLSCRDFINRVLLMISLPLNAVAALKIESLSHASNTLRSSAAVGFTFPPMTLPSDPPLLRPSTPLPLLSSTPSPLPLPPSTSTSEAFLFAQPLVVITKVSRGGLPALPLPPLPLPPSPASASTSSSVSSSSSSF